MLSFVHLEKNLMNARRDISLVFLRSYGFTKARYSSKELENQSTPEVYSIQGDDDHELVKQEKEADLQKQRNKSRLWPQHYNILHGEVPYDEPKCETHLSLRYKKRMFGRYGYKSKVNPGVLWPTLEDIKERYEYEKVAYPYTIEQMLERARDRRELEEKQVMERQTKIANNLKKLDTWKKDIVNRAAKREELAAAAKAKKDALIEEVRQHFDYKVDPRDERFQEMLIVKAKEQKKKLRAEKEKAYQERLMTSLGKESKT